MLEAAPHLSVLLHEVVHYMDPKEGETYIDGTFGAGGYSKALLEKAPCVIYAIDRDPDVKPYADALSNHYPGRLTLCEGSFGHMEALLAAQGITGVDGIMLDIGVSSMQLDRAERGFSFMQDGPLDMRMGKAGKSAYDLVNNADEKELADIIYLYGEEHKSRQIARKIVEKRAEAPISRTSELASIVRSVVRGGKDKIDPATRTFQAIRIWVNDELEELQQALEAAEKLLHPGGRLVVVSFHSLEDSIVKHFLNEKSGKQEAVSRHQMVIMQEKKEPVFKLISRGTVKPSEEEIRKNPRARSARLRAAIRTGDGRPA